MAISVQQRLRLRVGVSAVELLRAGWPPLVAAGTVWVTGRYGFSPTDDEFVLAGSWRLLHGQVPHRDFVSARPVGSSILHLVDFALPGPLFLDGRLTTALEFVLTAAALLVLALRATGTQRATVAPRGAGLAPTACVALGSTAVMLANLHTFPLTPWHTVDGLCCGAVGWFLIDDGLALDKPGRRRSGLFLAGFAAICKQSFAPVPLIALAMLVARRGELRPTWRSPRVFVGDAVALAAAPVGYLVWIGAAGGLRDAVVQLTASPPVWGAQTLLGPWRTVANDPGVLAWGALFVAAAGGWAVGARSGRRAGRRTAYASAMVISVTLVGTLWGVTLGEPAGAGLVPFNAAAAEASPLLWWMCLILVGADAVARRRVFVPALGTCALAWMASLSWGYALPVLLQGSLVGSALILTWCRTTPPAPLPAPSRTAPPTTLPAAGLQGRRRPAGPTGFLLRAAPVALAGSAALATAAFVLGDRATHEYRDAPRAALTADLGSIAPAGRGIRTSTASVAYLRGLSECVRRHPAAWTAIVPDTAAAYPLLGLHNPFPSDWMLPQELVGDATARILATASDLRRTGDYLVLYRGEDPLTEAVKARLGGRPVSCGALTGSWQPASGSR